MTTIRRFDVLSVAKIAGAIGVVIGLIIGGIISLFSLLGSAMAAAMDVSGAGGMLFGAGAIVIAPIFYGVLMFVVGALDAFIYNLVASRIGGIKVELG